MLRFTRGTILTPYGVCTAGGGRAHVEIRAATFCTAHVLRAEDMWRTALKHGRQTGENYTVLSELQVRVHSFHSHVRVYWDSLVLANCVSNYVESFY